MQPLKAVFALFFVGLAICVAYLLSRITSHNLESRDEYIANFELNFSGIVFEIDSIEKNAGIVRLKSVKPDSINYDPRQYWEHFFCVIKGGQAELLTTYIDLYSVGDSVDVRSDASVYIYRQGKIIHTRNLKDLIILQGPLYFTSRDRMKF